MNILEIRYSGLQPHIGSSQVAMCIVDENEALAIAKAICNATALVQCVYRTEDMRLLFVWYGR